MSIHTCISVITTNLSKYPTQYSIQCLLPQNFFDESRSKTKTLQPSANAAQYENRKQKEKPKRPPGMSI
jgi:hypothetical protein